MSAPPLFGKVLRGTTAAVGFGVAVYAANIYSLALQMERLPASFGGDFFKPLQEVLPACDGAADRAVLPRRLYAFQVSTLLPGDVTAGELFKGPPPPSLQRSSELMATGGKVGSPLGAISSLQALERAQPYRLIRTARKLRQTFRLSDVYYAVQHARRSRMQGVRRTIQNATSEGASWDAAVAYCQRAEEVTSEGKVVLSPTHPAAVIIPNSGSAFGASIHPNKTTAPSNREVVVRVYYASPPITGHYVRDVYCTWARDIYATWVAVNVAKSMRRL